MGNIFLQVEMTEVYSTDYTDEISLIAILISIIAVLINIYYAQKK